MFLLFNMMPRLVITFLPRSKHLLISWLQSSSAVILEPQKIKSLTIYIISPPICHEVMGPDAVIFIFWMLSFRPAFSLFSFTFIKRLFSSSSLSAIRMVSSAYLRLLIFLLAILIPWLACYATLFLNLLYYLCIFLVLWWLMIDSIIISKIIITINIFVLTQIFLWTIEKIL